MKHIFSLSFLLVLLFITNDHSIWAQKTLKALEYRCIGPSRGGRATAVCGVNTQPNVYYMGATGGGLWKTEDYGIHWKNISDGYFATPSIGAIAVFQDDPNTLYVGTGSDAIRSNVIVGRGMYKSTDAGKTWTFAGLKDAGQIGAVLIHPDNPDQVYVAVIGQPFRKSVERGVYRSTDGGQSWENVLFHSDSVGCVDLEFAPDNPNIIYAGMWRAERKPWTIISGGGKYMIYKSTDGGNTWKQVTSGLPPGLMGKVDFAVSADNPARVWALIQASDGEEGIYRSDDYAESWTNVEMPDSVHTSIMYRPFYFTNIEANPQNADRIWSGTKTYWTSSDGGKSWKTVPITHSDHHDLWINPLDTLLMIESNDGGGAVTRDGGMNWSSVFNQPTAEMYSCYVDDQYPYYCYSGQQDNSTIRVPSRRPFLNVLSSNDNHGLEDMMFWERVGGCETGPVIPKPGDPDILYANCKGEFSVYNRRTGLEQNYFVGAEDIYGSHPDEIMHRFQRVTPMEVSPHAPNTVYYGSQYLHKTTNGGVNWERISPDLTANKKQYRMRSGGPIDEDISGEEFYNVIYAIEESPLEPGLIWVGSNDGFFHITRDGGKHWENVTPEMPEGGRIQKIEVSPHHPAKAYFCVNRDYLGDESPYIYKTEDYGKTWKRLTDGNNGIPQDNPARVVREDPDREGLLYAGTEFGLFISFDDGNIWHTFQRNLPVTPVTDIRVHRKELVLSTLGRSFWIMDDITPLHVFNPGMSGFYVFEPRTTIGERIFFHYMIPGNATNTDSIKVEISRGDEVIVSRYEKMQHHPADQWGIRYTEWDLRYFFDDGGSDFKGPLVAPSTFAVALTYGNQRISKNFDYVMHPEWEAAGMTVQDLQEQETLSLGICGLLLVIKAEIRHLETKLKEKDDSMIRDRLAILEKGPGRYDKPMIYDQVEYLYDMISKVQQKPGQDAHVRYANLRAQWDRMEMTQE